MTGHPPLPPPGRRILILIAVMAATMMQVVDSTIANVALPHMQAALGATQESVAWVLTSYIVAAAIATPLTGWLESRIGRRNLFMIAIAGFTLCSALCGLAASLAMMVAARAAQGIFGALIAPLGQAALLDTFPPSQRSQVMTLWGMGIMVAPIMGPVLGGWLTDSYDWRWVFFINVPIGVIAFLGMRLLDPLRVAARRFDLFGFTLLAAALAGLQLMLDRGTQRDWFESPEIIIESGVAIGAFWMFVVHSLTGKAPLIPLALFRDRNFVLANLFMVILAGTMIAGSALTAPMLQRLLGYDTMGAGLMTAPRGLAMMVSMVIAGRLTGKVDMRILIIGGMALVTYAQWMMTGFNLAMGSSSLIWSGVIQGFGTGFVFLPLNLLAFATLSPALRTDAASLYALARNIGGSVAISIMTALIARNLQVSHSDLTAHVTTLSMPFLDGSFIAGLGSQGASVAMMIDAEINRQALMIAYIDDFWVMMWGALILVPLSLLLRKPRSGAAGVPHVAME